MRLRTKVEFPERLDAGIIVPSGRRYEVVYYGYTHVTLGFVTLKGMECRIAVGDHYNALMRFADYLTHTVDPDAYAAEFHGRYTNLFTKRTLVLGCVGRMLQARDPVPGTPFSIIVKGVGVVYDRRERVTHLSRDDLRILMSIRRPINHSWLAMFRFYHPRRVKRFIRIGSAFGFDNTMPLEFAASRFDTDLFLTVVCQLIEFMPTTYRDYAGVFGLPTARHATLSIISTTLPELTGARVQYKMAYLIGTLGWKATVLGSHADLLDRHTLSFYRKINTVPGLRETLMGKPISTVYEEILYAMNPSVPRERVVVELNMGLKRPLVPVHLDFGMGEVFHIGYPRPHYRNKDVRRALRMLLIALRRMDRFVPNDIKMLLCGMAALKLGFRRTDGLLRPVDGCSYHAIYHLT